MIRLQALFKNRDNSSPTVRGISSDKPKVESEASFGVRGEGCEVD